MDSLRRRLLFLVIAVLMPASIVRAQTVHVDCELISDKDYSQLASVASEIGGTHLHCTGVEPSIWQWDIDRNDPYPNWSVLRPSIFKLYVPKALRKYLPEDYARRNLDNLKKRVELLSKYNLKPIYSGFDPAYLPEAAYRDHPEWRGPRCDQSRRARNAYYAPCVDNPEMRALYVEAITEICKVIPFEKFDFLVNDSGSGLCWYPHLYPGANGPTECKNIPLEERIVNLLSIYQEGARNAGVESPQVNLSRYLKEDIVKSTIPHLKQGQYILNRNAKGYEAYAQVGFSSFYETFFPISQMPRIAFIASQLQSAQKAEAKNFEIGLRGVQETDAIRYLKRYMKEPIGVHASDLAKSLEWLASTFVGEENADRLVSVWYDIEKLDNLYQSFNTGGHMFRLGTVHQRWLTRPLVFFPEELKDEEKQYWRPYLFQAGTEADALDLTMLQAHRWLGGYGGYFSLMKHTNIARPIIERDVNIALALESKAKGKESYEYIHGLRLRLQAFKIIVENALNTVEFQYHMDEVRMSGDKPHDNTYMIQYQGDAKYTKVDQLLRSEIENCYRLIKILNEAERDGVQVVVMCEKPELQNIMLLNCDLRKDLEKKVRIMLDHRSDIDRVFRSPNH